MNFCGHCSDSSHVHVCARVLNIYKGKGIGASKQWQASKGKGSRDAQSETPRSRSSKQHSGSAECNGSVGRLLGWAVGPAGLGQPSVGGCMDAVWLCTDDIPYGGIMS